jgi:predicted HicB family RNase H-like nuclease
MTNLMEYRGYCGSVNFHESDEVFFGKLEFIRDLVTYEATDAKNLIKSFHEAVDDYLADCASLNRVPNQPFKGTFNVRVTPELHKEASLYAAVSGESLNNVVKRALTQFITNHAQISETKKRAS